MANDDDNKTDQTSSSGGGNTGGTTGGATSGSTSNSSGNNASGNTGSGTNDAPVSTSGTNDAPVSTSGNTNDTVTTSGSTGGAGGSSNAEEQVRALPAEAVKAAAQEQAPEVLTTEQKIERAIAGLDEEHKTHARAGGAALVVGVTDPQLIKAAIEQTIANVTGNHTPEPQQQQQAPLTQEERAKQQVQALMGGGGLSALIGGMVDHHIPVHGAIAQAQAQSVALDPALKSGGISGPGQ